MSVRFEGYAAVFDRVDRAGDVIRSGAFAGAVPVPLLWGHAGAPVGMVEGLGEDATGLRILARIDAAEPARLVRSGAVAGLSVGYRPVRVRQGGRRELLAVDLVEVRLVLAGASLRPPAAVHAVRDRDGIAWTRRSRAGWGWRDGGDAPLVEETERYRVTLVAPDGATTEVDTDAPRLAGPVVPGTCVTIRQRGTWADSLPTTITV